MQRNMETETNQQQSVKADLLSTIKKGEVEMRPRWHFLLQTALAVMGACFLILGLLYAASLAIFLVRTSGASHVPEFGPFGWFEFFFMLPWFFILGAVVFLIILEALLRRFAFAYRQPILYSFAVLLALAVIGAIVLDRMELHSGIRAFSSSHGLAPIEGFYHQMEGARPCCVVIGQVIEDNGNTGVVIRRTDGRVAQVIFDLGTQFPEGRSFATSNMIILFGDGDDMMIHAKGVRSFDQ